MLNDGLNARKFKEGIREIVVSDRHVDENAVADWQREAEKKGLVLVWQDQSTTIPQVKSAFAESVIDNLLRNTLQYTERGQVTVVLTDCSLSVADTGRGIADEEKTSVLQAFVRGDTAPGEGYGTVGGFRSYGAAVARKGGCCHLRTIRLKARFLR